MTGATGFIGSRLARRLVDENWDLHVIVRADSKLDRIADLPSVVHVDDGRMPMHEIVRTAAPDVCFHLAGYVVGAHKHSDISSLIADNLLFGTRLADALAANGHCDVVNAGSYWQNAGGRAYHPVALYAATKQAFQDLLQFYVESNCLRVVTLKFFETYGPGDHRPKLINLMLQAAATGRSIDVSPGDQFVDLVHVDDAVEACLAAARALQRPEQWSSMSYSVTTGAPMRLRDLVNRIEQIIGQDVPVEWGRRAYRWREMMVPWDVAPVVPDWTPAVSLESGIGAMWENLVGPDLGRRLKG